MMKKQKVLHAGTIVLILVFCFLAIGSGTKEKATVSAGLINQARQIEKDFVGVGIIFLNSEAKIAGNGNILSGSKITYEMVMKEVERLGGDDVLNLRIDEHKEKNGVVKYVATALVIKYVTKGE